MRSPAPDPATVLAAQNLAVDRTTLEVVEAMREAGIPSILLRGPALEELLYEGEVRGYVDADLLVPPEKVARAGEVLRAQGFVELPLELEPAVGQPHARTWGRRSDGAQVDLHRIVAGVGLAPHELWETLARETQGQRLLRGEVRVLSPAGRALVVALHCTQHGPGSRPQEDLTRAVDRLPYEVWRRAATLADATDATASFTYGLRMVAPGAALADRLGLPGAHLVEASLEPGSPTRLALGFERLAATPGARAKLGLIRRELFPSPSHMRWWSPLAQRSPAGLAAAYVWRTVLFLRHSPASLRAWRRYRRAS